MYQFSDSESIDSDEGIRYKTESIRNKKTYNVDRESDKKRDKYRSRERRRSRSRSRSRNRYSSDKKNLRKRKRDHSPTDDTKHKTNTTRNKDSENKSKKEDRSRKDALHRKIENSSNKTTNRQMVDVDTIPPGPSLPKSEISSSSCSDKKQAEFMDNPLENIERNLQFGPALPPKTNDLPKAESAFGPELPPHLLKKSPETSDNTIGSVLPPHFVTISSLEDDISSSPEADDETTDTDKVIGPSLPPILLKTNEGEATENVIGPALPPHLQQQTQSSSNVPVDDGSDEEGVYGPILPGAPFSQAHIELEERALQMKLDQLDPSGNTAPVREEWMLTLPAAKAANFGLGPRQFRSKAGPDFSDRSSWTDTPEDKAKKKEGKAAPVIDLKKEAEMKQIESRNREQETIARKHKKEKDSLLEIHRKKLKKEKKNEGGPSERRPFSRDIDLQVNRFDEAQKKAVLKKAQLLDTRFSSGESKFL